MAYGEFSAVMFPHGVAAQHTALKALQSLPVEDAIGAACSFLLHCSYQHTEMTRRVLNEKVIRHGFRGISLLEHLNKVGK